MVLFFFFQAEDGIRDFHVTGVQTCALPISMFSMARSRALAELTAAVESAKARERAMENMVRLAVQEAYVRAKSAQDRAALRSEERRVGKECRSRGVACAYKKKNVSHKNTEH